MSDVNVDDVPPDGDSSFHEDACVLSLFNMCKYGDGETPLVKVTKKGLETLIEFSQKRSCIQLTDYLKRQHNIKPGGKISIHKDCRRDFTDKKRTSSINTEAPDDSPCSKRMRSNETPFNFKEDCFLCGNNATIDIRHADRNRVRRVTTLPMRDKLLERCKERDDSWGLNVQKCLLSCIDLVAAEAVYHAPCFSLFLKGTGENTAGRMQSVDMLRAFDAMCTWLEAGEGTELYTLAELHTKMVELALGSESYSMKHMKRLLEERYEECIFFAEVEGRNNVVCFRDMAKYLINEKWYADKKDNIEEETERVVVTAAKVIRAQLREMIYDKKTYPTSQDISDIEHGKKWIPRYLQTFLDIIIPSEIRQTSIGHSIVQSARSKSVITPLLFGVGVEMDHVFGSRWLVEELFRLGFSVSYDEVIRYKQSVIQTESLDNLLAEYFPGAFTQWVADNVDHNVATVDGRGSFHGMGIIAVSTPTDNKPLTPRPRAIVRQERMEVGKLIEGKGVPILKYDGSPVSGLSLIKYKPLLELRSPVTLPPGLNADLLWHCGWLTNRAINRRPNWSGFMEHVFSADISKTALKSEVLFLPIIDLNPSDESCLFSTLTYVQNQAARLGIDTPCLTFDQPLWLKAVNIIAAKSLNIVCRLGGFHLMMSFLGSIGSMMKGSGLEEALEKAYGQNVVVSMLSGKAISRAVRGHFMVDSALTNRLLDAVISRSTNVDCQTREPQFCSDTLHTTSAEISSEASSSSVQVTAITENDGTDSMNYNEPEKLDQSEVNIITDLYEKVFDGSLPVSAVSDSKELLKLEQILCTYRALLAERSRTAKLWLQYMEYIQVLKKFIRAERTGDWNLHLTVVGEMLNLFAATGHVHYAKSCRLYLQMMTELPLKYPWLYNSFMIHGCHTIRRSCRFWAGLSSDLVIEQVLMRSVKSRGGLTRGRGITEPVRQQWVYSMHKCAQIHGAMTDITKARHETSEQHVELGLSRCRRDETDVSLIQDWFDGHEPFDPNEPRLRSISSGLIAGPDDHINCDETELVGSIIQENLDDVSVAAASIKRSEQVRTLGYLTTGVKIGKHRVVIDPTLLFTRLIAIAQREDNIEKYFEFELTVVPTSLFKETALRKPTKSQLANVITDGVELSQSANDKEATLVLDGGALLHRVKWQKNGTYKDIAYQYIRYVDARYGKCVIVFDGYGQEPSIKDHEHQRRVVKTCADIHLTECTQVHNNQEVFLSNEKNKHQFIQLLSRSLRDAGHVVHNSTSDADTMLVSVALKSASNRQVVVVSDDTDVLLLLVHHWNESLFDIYFKSEMRKSHRTGGMWEVGAIQQKVGEVIVRHILFLHAWGGCDTTSAVYGQGKTILLKKIDQSIELQRLSNEIRNPTASNKQVGEAGSQLFAFMYSGKGSDVLTHIRYTKFMGMVSSSRTSIEPQKLPPSERAAFFHSLRVHLQVVIWESLGTDDLDPTQWGWELRGSRLNPIMSDIEPAPENLLKFIRCNCKMSARNTCGGNMCSCRKNGLKCVTACGDCRGEGCKNTEEIMFDDDRD